MYLRVNQQDRVDLVFPGYLVYRLYPEINSTRISKLVSNVCILITDLHTLYNINQSLHTLHNINQGLHTLHNINQGLHTLHNINLSVHTLHNINPSLHTLHNITRIVQSAHTGVFFFTS